MTDLHRIQRLLLLLDKKNENDIFRFGRSDIIQYVHGGMETMQKNIQIAQLKKSINELSLVRASRINRN